MPTEHRILLRLADPQGRLPSDQTLPPPALQRVLRAAGEHGVLPTVVGRLPAGLAGEVPKDTRDLLQAQAANTLLLRQMASGLLRSLATAGLPAAVVKGPTFAERLYRGPFWRPFTDIDLLIGRDDMERAGALLADQGFAPEELALKHAEGYAETKWIADRGLEVLVELHWDMIGSPTLRRGRRLDLALLGGPKEADTPGAFLLIAAVHTALGDGFTRLQPLVDLLLTVRGAAGPLDPSWLRPRIEQGRLGRPLALALAIAGRAFEEPRCTALSAALALPRPPRWLCRLLSDSLLVEGRRGGGPLSSLRRQLVREWLKERP